MGGASVSAALSDAEIRALIEEPKLLPPNYRSRLHLRHKRGRNERHLDVTGQDGGEYRIIATQSVTNPLSFSVILVCRMRGSNRLFRLRRYNGKSHQHTNRIEGRTFYDCHIHMATERYQRLGMREDSYAEVTDRFADLDSALNCLVGDCMFQMPTNGIMSLFGEGQ